MLYIIQVGFIVTLLSNICFSCPMKNNTIYIFKANWDQSGQLVDKYLKDDYIKQLTKENFNIVQIDCSDPTSSNFKFMLKFGKLASPCSAMICNKAGVTSFIKLNLTSNKTFNNGLTQLINIKKSTTQSKISSHPRSCKSH